MQLKEPFRWIIVVLVSSGYSCVKFNENSDKVSLTVEGGVSLVGPHCPGTVRLFCEGVDLATLGWTYNKENVIYRIVADDQVTSSPIYLSNPVFVSVSITSVSRTSGRRSRANFSSVLTVDLLELNKQNIKNITCGDFTDTRTQQVDVSDFFIPNITASYQSGILSRLEVHLQLCYAPSIMYIINLTGYNTAQVRSCVSTPCTVVFTVLDPTSSSHYDMIIVASNHSSTLKEFNLTIAYLSENYFKWTVNSTSCQQYSVRCTAAVAVSDSTLCSIKYTTNLGASTNLSIPLNTQSYLSYTSQPDTVHYFEFSAMVQDYLLIRENITRTANCRQPLFNPGVNFLITSTLEGATVTYSCPGTESSSSVCGPNGQWSPNTTLFTCPSPVPPVTCGVPSPPANGRFVGNVANASLVDTVIHYRCDDGLFPMSNLSSVCGSDGVWSPNPEETVCTVLPYTFTCSLPAPPANGLVVQISNSTVVIGCREGFSPQENETAHCVASDQWRPSPEEIICAVVNAMHQSTLMSLSTGATVGVTLAVSAVVFTILGFLAGLLVMYLITRKKAVYSTADGQIDVQPTVPVGPVYEDVLPPSKEEIELNINQAYGPVGGQ